LCSPLFTAFSPNFKLLTAVFPPHDIWWRGRLRGRVLHRYRLGLVRRCLRHILFFRTIRIAFAGHNSLRADVLRQTVYQRMCHHCRAGGGSAFRAKYRSFSTHGGGPALEIRARHGRFCYVPAANHTAVIA
jgi:hypothetical protein